MSRHRSRRADRAPGRCRAGGGLLGGKDPTGRFCSARTVCKTDLLLAVLGSHQLPCLCAEVPDPLTDDIMVWTNTIPAVDLLIRHLVAAAGFRLVMFPLLLGQAILRG